jgi:hypothetical protein
MRSKSFIVWLFFLSSAFGLQKSWAESQTSYDGNWYGKIECKGDDFNEVPAYAKDVSIEINGSKVIIGNIGDYTQGDPFTYEGFVRAKLLERGKHVT